MLEHRPRHDDVERRVGHVDPLGLGAAERQLRRQRGDVGVLRRLLEQVCGVGRHHVEPDQLPRPASQGEREVDDAVARSDVGDRLALEVDVGEHLVRRLPEVLAEPDGLRGGGTVPTGHPSAGERAQQRCDLAAAGAAVQRVEHRRRPVTTRILGPGSWW
jgi:hypothetical protein